MERAHLSQMVYLAQAVLEGHPTPIIVLTEDRRVVLWNRAADTLGFTAPEAIGRAIDELLSPSTQREHLDEDRVRVGDATFVVLTRRIAVPDREAPAPRAEAALTT